MEDREAKKQRRRVKPNNKISIKNTWRQAYVPGRITIIKGIKRYVTRKKREEKKSEQDLGLASNEEDECKSSSYTKPCCR